LAPFTVYEACGLHLPTEYKPPQTNGALRLILALPEHVRRCSADIMPVLEKLSALISHVIALPSTPPSNWNRSCTWPTKFCHGTVPNFYD